MRKIAAWALLAVIVALPVIGLKANSFYGFLANETGLSYQKHFVFDMGASGAKSVSFQTNLSSAVIPAVTFIDGVKSTGSFTMINTTLLSTAAATNSITIASLTGLTATFATNSITFVNNSVSGTTITVNGIPFREGAQWKADVTYSSMSAVALAAEMNRQLAGVIVSSVDTANSVIRSTAVAAGSAGNAFTVVSTTGSMTVANPTFTGGWNTAYLLFNGRRFYAGTDWTVAGSAAGTATNLAAAINGYAGIAAAASASVVYATATYGSAGNSYTMSSSTPAALTVAAANFSGGQDAAVVSVGNLTFACNKDWQIGSGTGTAATNLAAVIYANSYLQPYISTSVTNNVITITAKTVGTFANAIALKSSVPSSISASNTTMTGGKNSTVDLGNDRITISSHGIPLAFPVLYTRSGSVEVTGLTTGTTYYAIPVDANTVKLAATSTGAVAGLTIDLTATAAAGGNTFTLTPAALSGSPVYQWQESNDGTNWINFSPSNTLTFSTPYTSTSTYLDMGAVNMRYIRLYNATAPTQGGVVVQVVGNGN